MKTIFPAWAAPLAALLALAPSGWPAAAFPGFQRHVINAYPVGYQVAVADVNGDGRPDVLGLSTEKDRVDWFENPGWRPHPIARTLRNIDLAPRRLAGRLGLALASGFYFSEASRGGEIQWLEPASGTNLWTPCPVAVEPVAHRLRWGDLDGDGQPELVHAPIFGPGSRANVDPHPSRLRAFRPPANSAAGAWTPWDIDETLLVLHGLYVGDLDHDGRDEVLTASFGGLHRFDWEGQGPAAHWVKTQLGTGAPPLSAAPGAARGSSEVVPGCLRPGQPFLAAIEPWHGDLLVVYTPPAVPGCWLRRVIDDSLREGHALAAADLDGDGRDELIVGWRGGAGGLAIYQAGDEPGGAWRKIPLAADLAVEGLAVADLNGDGQLDLVAMAGRSNLLVWFEQMPTK